MKKMKLILNESLISNADTDVLEDVSVQRKPDFQVVDVTVIPDEEYYPTIQSILINLDENNKLKESDSKSLSINILSETVNQKTGYSNSLFEFESTNHTITLSLVLQETDRRGIYKVEAYTTKGIKIFESNTYKPRTIIESFLNSLANEYLIDKSLKESIRIYDDEKDYSSDLSEVFNIVAEFINDEFTNNNDKYVEYSYGSDRVKSNEVFKGLSQILSNNGFSVSKDRVKHYANIGNNNGYEVFKGDECIGFLHINNGLYGEAYVYITDINDNRIGGSWELSPAKKWVGKSAAIFTESNLKEAESIDKEEFHKFAEKMKRIGFLDMKDITALSDNGLVNKLSFSDLNMFERLNNLSYQDIQDMIRKELNIKEADEPVEDSWADEMGEGVPVDEEKTSEEYSVSDYMRATQLSDDVKDLNINYSEWNEMSPEERKELVRPEMKRFVDSHRNEFDKNQQLFDLMIADLIDYNFHTEADVLVEEYRGGKGNER